MLLKGAVDAAEAAAELGLAGAELFVALVETAAVAATRTVALAVSLAEMSLVGVSDRDNLGRPRLAPVLELARGLVAALLSLTS